jgi:hypothetical protein
MNITMEQHQREPFRKKGRAFEGDLVLSFSSTAQKKSINASPFGRKGERCWKGFNAKQFQEDTTRHFVKGEVKMHYYFCNGEQCITTVKYYNIFSFQLLSRNPTTLRELLFLLN